MKTVSTLKLQLFARGISQTQIARKAGVHRSYICAILNGRQSASPKVKKAFCEVLGMNENQLFGGEKKQKAS